MSNSYITGSFEGHINFINYQDLVEGASKVIPGPSFGYIHSGAEDLYTYDQNVTAFNHKLIVPHVLMDVEQPDTSFTFDNDKLTAPIIMAPVAAHALAHEKAEEASAD